MKLRYCLALICLFTFLNLSPASAVDGLDETQPPVFAYDFKTLDKPKGMGDITWLRELEVERNKADCIGSLEAFKALSLEISATLAGKYGVSTRLATPEEQAAYAMVFTKFSEWVNRATNATTKINVGWGAKTT